MAAVAIAPLGYMVVKSIPLLMVIRAFHGISIAAFTTGYSALVADIAPPKSRRSNWPHGESDWYGNGASSGDFTGWNRLHRIISLISWTRVCGLFCTSQILNPPDSDSDSKVIATSNQFWRCWVVRAFVPALVLLLVGLAFGALSTFAPLFIKSVGVDLNVGLFYTAAAIASFSVRDNGPCL